MPGPAQLLLFPTDAEEQLLWSRCERIKRLPEKQAAIVRAYLRSLRTADRAPEKKDWILEAETAGVGRTTFYETLQQHGTDIHAAVMEALQLVGKRAWLMGALAAELAMVSLYSQLASGRSTSSLTAQELQLMMAAIELSGQGVRRGQAVASVSVTDSDGRRIEAQVGVVGEDQDLVASLSYLRERQRRTLGEAVPSAEAESVQAQGLLGAGAGAESAEGRLEGGAEAGAESAEARREGGQEAAAESAGGGEAADRAAGKLERAAGVAAGLVCVLFLGFSAPAVAETGRLAEREAGAAGAAAACGAGAGQAPGWVGVRGRARFGGAAGDVSCARPVSEKIAEKPDGSGARCPWRSGGGVFVPGAV